MRARNVPRVRKLQRDLRRAQELVDGRELDEARQLLSAVRAAARELGLRSAHLHWMLAAACDYAGEYGMAVECIEEALNIDPLSLPALRSFDIIAGHLRAALCDEERALDAQDTPALYGLLLEMGETDLPCHLAMARHEAQVGKDAEAQRRVEATLTLFPYSAEAWTLKAQLAAKAGDEEGRQRALVEAAALGAEPAFPRPFGMPGQAQG